MRFKITVYKNVFYADMIENSITKEIEKHLPLELVYNRYTEHEYYTRLPFFVSCENCKKQTLANKNEIWYFDGWNALTILFDNCDTSPFEVVKLGDVNGDIASFLKDGKDKVKILLELDN